MEWLCLLIGHKWESASLEVEGETKEGNACKISVSVPVCRRCGKVWGCEK